MSTDAQSPLPRLRGAIERIDIGRLEPAEAERQLKLQQAAVARYVAAAPPGSPLGGLVGRIEPRGELIAWEQIARELEAEHPDLLRVDDISDYRVPILGGDRALHISPPDRVGAWKEHALAVVDALIDREQAVQEQRESGSFKYPYAQTLLVALSETCRACGFYQAVIQYLGEPIESDDKHEPLDGALYAPPEECLPLEHPELLVRRAEWEVHRDQFGDHEREEYRRLDNYFTARHAMHQAVDQCRAAADAASLDLDDESLPPLKQVTIRIRASLDSLSRCIPPWFGGKMMLARMAGTWSFKPLEDVDGLERAIAELQALADEIRPVAEQRTGAATDDPPPADLINHERAAEIAEVSAKTIREWLDADKLPHYGHGRKVSESELRSKLPSLRERKPRKKKQARPT